MTTEAESRVLLQQSAGVTAAPEDVPCCSSRDHCSLICSGLGNPFSIFMFVGAAWAVSDTVFSAWVFTTGGIPFFTTSAMANQWIAKVAFATAQFCTYAACSAQLCRVGQRAKLYGIRYAPYWLYAAMYLLVATIQVVASELMNANAPGTSALNDAQPCGTFSSGGSISTPACIAFSAICAFSVSMNVLLLALGLHCLLSHIYPVR